VLDESAMREVIRGNLGVLDDLLRQVEHASTRRPRYAAALAQAAAEYAWFNHTGWFTSPDLERIIRKLGRDALPRTRVGRRATRTIHVVTQMYQTGGSTQALASWTDELSDRAHEIVVTRQRTASIPEKVTQRLSERVRLTRLDTRPGSLLSRAARLRDLARSADLVLVHAHPYDVVPALAFADRAGLPPVVYVDHADHVFWLGVTAVDHVMHMRHSGQRLALQRRGLPVERSLVLNRPLVVRGRTIAREAAKAEWGICGDEVLVVTAADASKFHCVDGPSLADLVEPAIHASPEMRWRIAGPSPDEEPWAGIARRTSGRAQAVGRLDQMHVLHQAADIYLDSYPFASLTSLLESGAYENPVVTFRGHPDTCAVYGADSPGVDEHMFRPSTAEELQRVLCALASDQALREQRGTATARAVTDGHTGDGWRRSIETMYALPAGMDSEGSSPVNEIGALDLLTASVQANNPFSRGVEYAVAAHLGTMPLRERVRAWRRARSEGEAAMKALAPEWATAAVKSRVLRRAD
jgi:hypothetical protein